MAKILVVGSRKDHDVLEFRAACRDIGSALAKRGHTIVAAGCGDDDAETWVLDGANSVPNTRPKLIPFTPAVPNTQDLLQTADIGTRWPKLELQPPFETKGPWAVGQAVALIRSDAAILIGGGPLTANVGSLALELDKPYYAVSELGGAAQTVAAEDFNKHRTIGMPEELLKPKARNPQFGENVVRGTEFVIRHRKERTALRNNILILIISLTILALFLGFLFRHDLWGNEPRLVYTTSLGAIVGVVLLFLVGHVVERESISVAEVLGQISLACFLGVLYGFFALEAGSFYKVNIASMSTTDVDSLAIKMAVLGVGVGALLGPASKRAIEELRRIAKLKGE